MRTRKARHASPGAGESPAPGAVWAKTRASHGRTVSHPSGTDRHSEARPCPPTERGDGRHGSHADRGGAAPPQAGAPRPGGQSGGRAPGQRAYSVRVGRSSGAATLRELFRPGAAGAAEGTGRGSGPLPRPERSPLDLPDLSAGPIQELAQCPPGRRSEPLRRPVRQASGAGPGRGAGEPEALGSGA